MDLVLMVEVPQAEPYRSPGIGPDCPVNRRRTLESDPTHDAELTIKPVSHLGGIFPIEVERTYGRPLFELPGAVHLHPPHLLHPFKQQGNDGFLPLPDLTDSDPEQKLYACSQPGNPDRVEGTAFIPVRKKVSSPASLWNRAKMSAIIVV